MSKIIIKKKDLYNKKDDMCSCGFDFKKVLSFLSIIAVISISTSAIAWIGFMNIKQNNGKLPWER